jgi:Phosphodiester glycosidase
MKFFLAIIASCVFCTANAQLNWKNIDSVFAPLPPDVHVFFTNDSVGGKPNIAYYISANISNKTLNFSTQVGFGKRYTPSQFYVQEDSPLVVVNSTFFEFKENKNLNLVVKNKQLLAYSMVAIPLKKDTTYKYISRAAIGITKSRKASVVWAFTDSSKKYAYALKQPIVHNGNTNKPTIQEAAYNNNQPINYVKWKVKTAIGGGPRLLENGNILITNNEEHLFLGKKGAEEDKHPRTAMGITADNKIIILVVQGRTAKVAEGMSLTQLATTLKDIGCMNALNVDGGGSSCMLINGKPTIQVSDKEGQRPVPSVFIIK